MTEQRDNMHKKWKGENEERTPYANKFPDTHIINVRVKETNLVNISLISICNEKWAMLPLSLFDFPISLYGVGEASSLKLFSVHDSAQILSIYRVSIGRIRRAYSACVKIVNFIN